MHCTIAVLGVDAAGLVWLPDLNVMVMQAYHLGERGETSEASL